MQKRFSCFRTRLLFTPYGCSSNRTRTQQQLWSFPSAKNKSPMYPYQNLLPHFGQNKNSPCISNPQLLHLPNLLLYPACTCCPFSIIEFLHLKCNCIALHHFLPQPTINPPIWNPTPKTHCLFPNLPVKYTAMRRYRLEI